MMRAAHAEQLARVDGWKDGWMTGYATFMNDLLKEPVVKAVVTALLAEYATTARQAEEVLNSIHKTLQPKSPMNLVMAVEAAVQAKFGPPPAGTGVTKEQLEQAVEEAEQHERAAGAAADSD